MTWHINQPVVCIKDNDQSGEPLPHIVKGEKYTVGAVHLFKDSDITLELLELPQPKDKWWSPGFRSDHFRPAPKPRRRAA